MFVQALQAAKEADDARAKTKAYGNLGKGFNRSSD